MAIPSLPPPIRYALCQVMLLMFPLLLEGSRGRWCWSGTCYRGQVITNAARGGENVKSLVYVAACAPRSG